MFNNEEPLTEEEIQEFYNEQNEENEMTTNKMYQGTNYSNVTVFDKIDDFVMNIMAGVAFGCSIMVLAMAIVGFIS